MSPRYPLQEESHPRKPRPRDCRTPRIYSDLRKDRAIVLLAWHERRYTKTHQGLRRMSANETQYPEAQRRASTFADPSTTLAVHRPGLSWTPPSIHERTRHDPHRR